MRAVGITFISLALTSAVIGNAYYQKKQFYPSVVYITKSNPSMAVIYVQALILVVLMGKLMRKIFFGQLRAAEFEHLMERSWYAVTETCLAFTVFRDDFSPKFVALFTVLLFIKSFHWLAEERVDFMERSPVISWLFHIRVIFLLSLLGTLDLSFVELAYQSTVTKGASVQLVFGFEYAILLTIIINIFIKYALHTLDLNSENPWDNKAVFLLYTELVMGFCKVVLYIAFVLIMVRIYTLPLFAFRPMYYTMRSFKKAFNDVILSRRAIRNMNTLYPDATPEELAAADNVCIICREEMLTASKKLPCNHIFHTSCLRSWFQRQQTCPTCRLNILRTPTAPSTPAPAPQRAPQHARPAEPQAPPNMFQASDIRLAGGPNQLPAGFVPFWQPFQQPGAEPNPAAEPAAADATPNAFQPPNANATDAQFQQQQQNAYPNFQLFNPPFPFMPPFTMPPPMPPPNLAVLSDEELHRMEGQARDAVESRIRCLENIQLLLDASVALMQQYSLVAGTPSHPVGQPAPTFQPQADATSSTQPQPPSTSQDGAGQSGVSPSSSAPVIAAAIVEEVVELASRSEDVKSSSSVLTSPSSSTKTPSSSSISTEAQAESQTVGASTPVLTKEQEEIRRRRLEKFAAPSVANAE